MPTRRRGSRRSAGGIQLFSISAILVFAALSAVMLAVHPVGEPTDVAGVDATPVTTVAPAEPAAPATPLAPTADGNPPVPVAIPVPAMPVPASPEAPAPRKPAPAPPASTVPVRPAPPAATGSRGTLVFVIDDAGHNTWQLEPFLAIPGPLTIAVLPGLPHTRAAAAMAAEAGVEVLLHQPMEALNDLDPGPGAIMTGMSDAEIRMLLRGNLEQVPGAVGVNNHMGSKATEDARIMSVVLEETNRAGLYYLDSLTVGDSVIHSVASLMGIRTWERTVFLDNSPDKATIIKFVTEGTRIAEKRGYAIMIGHVWSADLAQTLTELYPQLVEQGFSLSTISRLMADSGDEDSGD